MVTAISVPPGRLPLAASALPRLKANTNSKLIVNALLFIVSFLLA
jgi:hypothetical protein